jgi:transketolase
MIPALRMRAQMKLPILSFLTHDSFIVGRDGDCFQPIEEITQLRAIPGNTVYRPCDYKELVAAYAQCVKNEIPVCLALTKQNLEHIDGTSFEGALQGGYLLEGTTPKAEVVLVASGSEVKFAQKIASELRKKHEVNVVSMPSLEIFEKQSQAYKTKVLGKDSKLIFVIEATNDTKWYRVLGANCEVFGVSEYLGNGSADDLLEKSGFTIKNVAKIVEAKLKDKKK